MFFKEFTGNPWMGLSILRMRFKDILLEKTFIIN